MLSKKLRKKLHSIALLNNISDELAEEIIMSPFRFQRKILEEGRLEGKTTFYHKYIGKFYIRKSVVDKINRSKEHGERKSK